MNANRRLVKKWLREQRKRRRLSDKTPPEAVGDLAVPGVVGVGSDDGGLPASGDGDAGVEGVGWNLGAKNELGRCDTVGDRKNLRNKRLYGQGNSKR